MPRPSKLTFIITEVSGVAYYRVWQPAMAMRDMGVKTAMLWYKHDMIERPKWEWEIGEGENTQRICSDIDRGCQWGDAVVWMALHHPASFEYFQQLRFKYPNKPFLMELDDIVFDIPMTNVGSQAYYPGSPLHELAMNQIRLSDGLIVSTPYLKERLEKFGKPVYVVENTIDSSRWRGSPSPRSRRVNVGWVGGGTHFADLEIVKDAVFEILKTRKDVQFTFLHGCPEFFKHKTDCSWLDTNDPRYQKAFKCPRCGGIPGIKWTHKWARIDKYPKWVEKARFDIGLAPLQDNAFNRAKSNLRWLEYSAQGIPTIASPIENFKKTIHNKVNGLLASNTEEWVNQINSLVDDPIVRASIGKTARADVKAHWNPQLQAKKYLDAIGGFLAVTDEIKP